MTVEGCDWNFREAERRVRYTTAALDSTFVLKLACEKNLTFYDASYVALASILDVVLYTRDEAILKACPAQSASYVGIE